MKHLLIASLLLSRLIACDNISGVFNTTATDHAKSSVEMGVPLRDLSITSDNSYSDLFLDSAIVEHYIKSENIGDSAAQRLRYFYNSRNYQFAWFNSEGFTEQGRGFWSLYDYTNKEGEAGATLQDKDLQVGMDTLTEKDTLVVNTSDSAFFKTELAITNQFLAFAAREKNDHVIFANPYQFVPVKKIDPMVWADSVLNRADSGHSGPTAMPYDLLKKQLAKYYQAEKEGGWDSISLIGKALKRGESSPAVASIKKRLAKTGDWTGTDSSQTFDESLVSAIKQFKLRHGFDSTEQITDSVINEMNVPAADRIEQIIINMNRMRWLPAINKEQAIEVNIPDFMLRAYEGGSPVFDMKVVVGREGTSTMMFSGDMDQIVFSPYWNIPESIVKSEILPAMKSNPNYLKQHNMEVVKKNDSIPTIRQLPGSQNSLGKAKFLFPNSFDIFFHDTPAKELFDQDKRAFSHGCIRLEDAGKMAAYLLKDDQAWTPEKISQAMNSKNEQWVKLKKPVPVVITYYTAWVDADGRLNFRNDVYGHDRKTANRMFAVSAIPSQKGAPANDSMQQNLSTKDSARARA
jgi:murein L,D-transpeptidase YcbB/YkuD